MWNCNKFCNIHTKTVKSYEASRKFWLYAKFLKFFLEFISSFPSSLLIGTCKKTQWLHRSPQCGKTEVILYSVYTHKAIFFPYLILFWSSWIVFEHTVHIRLMGWRRLAMRWMRRRGTPRWGGRSLSLTILNHPYCYESFVDFHCMWLWLQSPCNVKFSQIEGKGGQCRHI